MLTVRQLLAVTADSHEDTLTTHALRTKFPAARPLSLKRVSAGYEKERVILFVKLISPNALRAPNVRSIADLMQAAESGAGQLDQSEVVAFSSQLQEQGLALRLVAKDLRSAAIVGGVPALVNAPVISINDGNLLQVRDATSNQIITGAAIITFGVGVAGVGGAFKNPGLAAFGLGIAAVGLYVVLTAPPPEESPPQKKESPQTSTTPPDPESPEGEPEDVEIPNAVAIGSPPNGFDTDHALQQLGDFTLDLILDNVLPVGWDTDAGVALAGIGGGLDGDGGDGGGFNPFGF